MRYTSLGVKERDATQNEGTVEVGMNEEIKKKE
jgi:hypothetical protein